MLDGLQVLDAFGAYAFVAREALILVIVAAGIYLLLRTGIFAVPHIGFVGIGAYVSAVISTRFGVPFWLSILVVVFAGMAAGFVLGLLLIRLDGIYLAIATIGFSEIVRVSARNLEITGGAPGITGIPRDTPDLLLIGFVAALTLVTWRVSGSQFGLMMEGLRDDQLATVHQGVNARRVRLYLFTATGALCAVAGSFTAHLVGFVEPGRFGFQALIEALAAAILGGITSPFGPIVGSTVVSILPEALVFLEDYRHIFNGVAIVLVVVFLPDGLAGGVGQIVRRRPPSASSKSSEAVVPQAASASKVSAPQPSPEPTRTGEPALRIERISKDFGGIRALDNVSFDLYPGEMLGLIGPNGSGKTTLLNVLSGVYVADSGSAVLPDGTVLPAGRPDLVSTLGIARTFQGIRLVHHRSSRDNMYLGAYPYHESGLLEAVLNLRRYREERERFLDKGQRLLAALGADTLADAPVGSLPYGPQRKVEIGRALMEQPSLLFVDEPTAGMTPVERREIFGLFAQTAATGVAVIVVEHDVESIVGWCHRVAVLNFGRLIAIGSPDEVVKQEAVIEAYLGK